MSGSLKTINDRLSVIDHKFEIINTRFLDVNRKIENIPSMSVPRKESVPSPPTPPVEVPTETVVPLTKPKDDLLEFLSSNRIKDILKIKDHLIN